MHAQLMADAYEIFVVMVAYDYSNAVVRALSSFQSAEAIMAVIPKARLFGMLFSGCGGAGHWYSIDIESKRIAGKEGIRGCMCKQS